MTKRKIKDELMCIIYMLNPKCAEVTIKDDFETLLETIKEYIVYVNFDNECYRKEANK